MLDEHTAHLVHLCIMMQVILTFIQADMRREHEEQRRRIVQRRHILRAKEIEYSNRFQKDMELLLLPQRPHPRRWWVAPRAHDWINMVLRGETLQDTEFCRTFRMTRNSFNQLHALLGMLSS